MYGKLNAPRVIPDRDAATRVDPRAALADDRGRYLLVRGDAVPFDGRLVFLTRREVTAFRASPAYLGLVDGVPYFALDATLAADVGGQRLAELPFVSLRSVGHLLNDAEATLALEAIALVAGIDRVMDMARTTINVLGDATAAIFISRTENDFDPQRGAALQDE